MRNPSSTLDRASIELFLHRIAIGAPTLRLRDEDRKKVDELAGLLPEIARALSRRDAPRIVDAASGSGWVGLSALALVAPSASVVAIERDPRKAERARQLADAAGLSRFEVRTADVAALEAWPDAPDLVVALHACGAASDLVIAGAAAKHARALLVAPCCVARALPLAVLAAEKAEAVGLPRHAPVRRRFVEAFVLAARLYTMESLGFETEAVAFAGETVTPYNVVLRGRRGRDRHRIARAKDDLARLTARGS